MYKYNKLIFIIAIIIALIYFSISDNKRQKDEINVKLENPPVSIEKPQKIEEEVKNEKILKSKKNKQALSEIEKNDSEYIIVKNANKQYNLLITSNDPQEKRIIRKKISKIKPSDKLLDYLIDKYRQANTEEGLYIQSIITQINAQDATEKFFQEAQSTQDEALFVSLIYALRKSNTIESKKALLALVNNNSLIPNTLSFTANKQSLSAINNALSDTISSSDITWMGSFIQNNVVSDYQLMLITKNIKKYPRKQTKELLELSLLYAKSNDTKNKIQEIININQAATTRTTPNKLLH